MTQNQKSTLTILILFPIIAFIGSVVQQILHGMSGWTENPVWIGWIGDILITIAAFLFRYSYADVDQLTQSLQESDLNLEHPLSEKNQLKPRRYLNIMPYAMLVGTIASIVINIQGSPIFFLAGMGIYFVMQVMLIIAFSGIVHLKFKILFSKKRVYTNIAIIGAWLIYMFTVFFWLILPGLEDLMLYLVPIYILSLIMMGIVAYLQLLYKRRSLGMRLILVLGATSFVFSDTLIGIGFTYTFEWSAALIQPTFILAIALISTAILFRSRKNSD